MLLLATAFLVGRLAAPSGDTPVSDFKPGGAQTSWTVWDFAADFTADSASPQNPSPDRYGNRQVWSYLEADDTRSHDRSRLRPLPRYGRDLQGMRGFDAWFGRSHYAASVYFPLVGVKGGGAPSERGFAHPSIARQAIVAWTSPIRGRVTFSGSVSDEDDGGGDGIRWALDEHADTLAGGTVANGGSRQTFSGRDVAVRPGDTFYLTIAPRDTYGHDSTRISFRITRSA